MQLTIYIILFFIQEITVGVFIHLLLTPKYSQKFCMLIWILTSWTLPVERMIQMHSENLKPFFLLFQVIKWIVIASLLYRDAIWKKIVSAMLTLCANVFGDALLIFIFYFVNPSYLEELTIIDVHANIMAVSAQAILLVVYMCFLQLWNLIRNRHLIKGYLPLLLLPISQGFFSVWADLSDENRTSSYSIAFFLGAFLGFCLDIYWMYELLYRSRKTEAERKLKEMHHMMELEQVHYQEIESKREDVAKLRHDINNQILAARHLISEGDTERSEHMLDQLLEQVSATKEYPYCAVPIINAILNEKNRLCEQNQIDLIADLSFPSDLHVDDVMLCSLFSNLLDNAIHAVKDMDPGKRWIRISAIMEGGFLVVKTRNPSGKPEPVKRGHGKGTVILREIAEMYGGTYQTEYREQIFTSLVSMELKKVYES